MEQMLLGSTEKGTAYKQVEVGQGDGGFWEASSVEQGSLHQL